MEPNPALSQRSYGRPRTLASKKRVRAPGANRFAVPKHKGYVPVEDLAPLSPESIDGLKTMFEARTGHAPREFQLQATLAQIMRKDVVVLAGTGSGKTAIAAAPHLLPESRGRVSILISPLLALHSEQEASFASEFGLSAKAINSSNGGCNRETMQRIIAGEWQIVILSPEMLLSKQFVTTVLRNREFGKRIVSVVVDEAHVVSHWGHNFRKKYGELGIIRAFLPRDTPIVALTATLTRRVRTDIERVLAIKEDHVRIDVGNDRRNVALVVRSMQYAANTFADLDFLVPEGVQKGNEGADAIDSAWIFADNITVGIDIVDHLEDLLPPALRWTGLIRPYNAAMSREYRETVMDLFKKGEVRLLVCTDAAGMGCNIPNIKIVVQWKMPSSLSAFVQRAGRAARSPNLQGLAVLIVEPGAYEDDLFTPKEAVVDMPKKKGRRRKRGAGMTKAQRRAYAISRGQKRGHRGSKSDAVPSRSQPQLDLDASDEGLAVFVQTGLCRRKVLALIYANAASDPVPLCCDICHPQLLNRTRPGGKPKTTRKAPVKTGEMADIVSACLNNWREGALERDYPFALFGADAILSDTLVETLASVGPAVQTRAQLENIMQGWTFAGKYMDDLESALAELEIPEFEPKPKAPGAKSRGRKRGVSQVLDASELLVPERSFRLSQERQLASTSE